MQPQYPHPQSLNALHLHQKITLMVNRYEVFADNGAGEPGALIAFAEQKRFKLKEQVTLYTGPDKQAVLAEFRARKVIDLGSGYDVVDGHGQVIGRFRKDFGRSLTRSTWHLENGAGVATGAERSMPVAIFRRLWGFIPFAENFPFPMRYHFDFVTGGGAPVFTVDKKTWVRDHYLITIADPSIDRRLVIAQAVALDALQSR